MLTQTTPNKQGAPTHSVGAPLLYDNLSPKRDLKSASSLFSLSHYLEGYLYGYLAV